MSSHSEIIVRFREFYPNSPYLTRVVVNTLNNNLTLADLTLTEKAHHKPDHGDVGPWLLRSQEVRSLTENSLLTRCYSKASRLMRICKQRRLGKSDLINILVRPPKRAEGLQLRRICIYVISLPE